MEAAEHGDQKSNRCQNHHDPSHRLLNDSAHEDGGNAEQDHNDKVH